MTQTDLSGHDLASIDTTIRRRLGVERGQSIEEVARRIVATAAPSPALHASRVLLSEEKRPDVWERMALAARILGWTR